MTRQRKALVLAMGLASAAFVAVLVWASTHEPLGDGFAALISSPWGWAMGFDLYVGLGLVAAWIHALERDWRKTVAWGLALIFLGNLATLAFLIVRAFRAKSSAALIAPRRTVPRGVDGGI